MVLPDWICPILAPVHSRLSRNVSPRRLLNKPQKQISAALLVALKPLPQLGAVVLMEIVLRLLP